MILKNLHYILFFLYSTQITAQHLPMVWPFGYGTDLNDGFGISYLDFLDGKVKIYAVDGIENFFLGDEGSIISDENGNPLLITNNCQIRNNQFQIIGNGDTLSPGPVFNSHCLPIGYYPLHQSTLFLPGIPDEKIYYLVHKSDYPSSIHQTVVSDKLYLTKIQQTGLNSFDVISKEVISDTLSNPANVTATVDDKLTGWWVYHQKFNTNEFQFYHIKKDTILGPILSGMGPILSSSEIGNGQIEFSGRGDYFAIPTISQGLHLYNFDNKTGKVLGHQKITLPNNDTVSGVCFSPSDRFLYVTSRENLYQIDLQKNNEVIFLAHLWEIGPTGWPVGLGYIYLGPDCRMYISPGTSSNVISVIHDPEEKGTACNVELKAIISPTRLKYGFPNIPRMDRFVSCDSSIQWGFVSGNIQIESATFCNVYPNPFKQKIKIETSIPGNLKVEVFNSLGTYLFTKPAYHGQELDLSEIQDGLYFLRIYADAILIDVKKIFKI